MSSDSSSPPSYHLFYAPTVSDGTPMALGRAHGPVALLNSYHHQAVDEVAPTLRVTATAPDGVVEGVEGDGVLGVQWHPEMLFGRHPHALATFTAFMSLLGVRA